MLGEGSWYFLGVSNTGEAAPADIGVVREVVEQVLGFGELREVRGPPHATLKQRGWFQRGHRPVGRREFVGEIMGIHRLGICRGQASRACFFKSRFPLPVAVGPPGFAEHLLSDEGS